MDATLRLLACMTALVAWAAAASAGDSPASIASKSFDFMGGQMTILIAGTDTSGSSALLDTSHPGKRGSSAAHSYARG